MGLRAQGLRRPLQGRHGKSLILGEILDQHFEEVYVSLLSEYGFDLVEWFEGKRSSSPAIILAMIRRLPAGTLFTAKLAALAQLEDEKRKAAGETEPEEDIEPSEEEKLERLIQEKLAWSNVSGLSELVALMTNRISFGVGALFPEKSRPKWDSVGPSWWPGTAKNKQKKDEESAEEPMLEGGVKPSLLTRFFAGKTGVHG